VSAYKEKHETESQDYRSKVHDVGYRYFLMSTAIDMVSGASRPAIG